jgi:hypothetical protein
MKVVFALRHVVFFRLFDGVIRELCARGHTVEALIDPHAKAQAAPSKHSRRAIEACAAETPGFTWDWFQRGGGPLRRTLFIARELINYSAYLKPGRQTSRMVLDRHEKWMPESIQRLMKSAAFRALLVTRGAQWALRLVDKFVPPDRAITQRLKQQRPDVVVASPAIMWWSKEIEYIKAAKALRIPAIVAVASWDNLTTKGIFQVMPDLTLVWNQVQIDEAIRLHDVPANRVIATGAPVFDPWFELQPTMDRASYCRQMSLELEQPYVLYLCSSKTIVEDERAFVEEVAEGLRQAEATRHVNLVVRPHPLHTDIWQDYAGEMTIWPRQGEMPDSSQARQDFFHALHFSAAVIGINTSALLEAAIADRPCLTILAERYRDTQQDIAHFQYLLNGDYLELAADIAQVSVIIGRILRGADAKRDNRRRFVRDFLRPWGIERPAAGIMAEVLEAAAKGQSIDQMQSSLSTAGASLGHSARVNVVTTPAI